MLFQTMTIALLVLLLTSPALSLPRRTLPKRQTISLSPNYSGAGILSPPDSTSFTYATTQINVPSTQFVSAEGSPRSIQKSAAWVGFGGTSAGGIIQTGCTFYNNGYQDQHTRCWYEFYPAGAVFYDGFSPSIGDRILLKIMRNSDTDGYSSITNLNTGEEVSAGFQAPDGSTCTGQDVEWIVEDPGGAAHFVNFQKQFFESCDSRTETGNTYGPGDASYTLFNEWKNLGDGASEWTNSFLSSDSEVEVDWVGPS